MHTENPATVAAVLLFALTLTKHSHDTRSTPYEPKSFSFVSRRSVLVRNDSLQPDAWLHCEHAASSYAFGASGDLSALSSTVGHRELACETSGQRRGGAGVVPPSSMDQARMSNTKIPAEVRRRVQSQLVACARQAYPHERISSTYHAHQALREFQAAVCGW